MSNLQFTTHNVHFDSLKHIFGRPWQDIVKHLRNYNPQAQV